MHRIAKRSYLYSLIAIAPVWLVGCGGGGTQSIVPEGVRNESTAASAPVVSKPADVWNMTAMPRDIGEASRVLTTAPTLVSPINDNQVVKSQGVTFTWNAVSGAKAYRVLISSSADFSTQIKFDLLGTGTTLKIPTIPSKQAEGRYYWKVTASDDLKKAGPYSTAGSFLLVSTSCGSSTTGTVSGTVTDVTTNGAISGATVQLDIQSLTATTDSNGNYTISNVPVGNRTGIVKRSGYLSAAIQTSVSPSTCVAVNVKLQQIGTGGGPPPPPAF